MILGVGSEDFVGVDEELLRAPESRESGRDGDRVVLAPRRIDRQGAVSSSGIAIDGSSLNQMAPRVAPGGRFTFGSGMVSPEGLEPSTR